MHDQQCTHFYSNSLPLFQSIFLWFCCRWYGLTLPVSDSEVFGGTPHGGLLLSDSPNQYAPAQQHMDTFRNWDEALYKDGFLTGSAFFVCAECKESNTDDDRLQIGIRKSVLTAHLWHFAVDRPHGRSRKCVARVCCSRECSCLYQILHIHVLRNTYSLSWLTVQRTTSHAAQKFWCFTIAWVSMKRVNK